MRRRMSAPSAANTSHPLLRVVVYGAAIVLALLHVFVTFRGLNSEAGMEQAQIARELARGHGFQTKVIRPYAGRLNASAKDVTPAAMPEITQPPLQSLIWDLFSRRLNGIRNLSLPKVALFMCSTAPSPASVSSKFLLTLIWTRRGTAAL